MATYSELANKEIYGQTTPVVESALPTPPITPPTPAGGTPVAKPVSVISTDKAKADVATNQSDLLKTLQEMQARLGVIQTSADKLAEEEKQAKLAEQNAQADTTAKDLATLGITPEKTAEQIAIEQQQAVVQSYQDELNTANTKMDNWVVANNERTASIIANLKSQYAARAKQVEDVYMRQSKSQEQLGIRLGTTRHGADSTGGILTEIENKKQTKLSELDIELQGLILEAEQASSDNEFKVLSQRMSSVQEKQDEAQKELQDLQKIALQRNQEMEDEVKTVKRQSIIAGMLNEGSSIGDILESGQFSVDEINGVVDVILKGQKQSDETSLGAYTDIEGNRIQPFYNKSTGEYREIALGKTTYSEEEKANISLQKSMQLEQFKAGLKASEVVDSGLVGAILENPELFNQLTATEKGKVAPELNKLGFTAFGKPLSDTAIKEITTTELALEGVKDLMENVKINEQYIGPISGIQSLNPYSKARQVQADLDRIRQRVGKALEGGVLRKEDEEKYKKILATMFDTPETALYKLKQLEVDLQREVSTYKNNQLLSGRNVPEKDKVDNMTDEEAFQEYLKANQAK